MKKTILFSIFISLFFFGCESDKSNKGSVKNYDCANLYKCMVECTLEPYDECENYCYQYYSTGSSYNQFARLEDCLSLNCSSFKGVQCNECAYEYCEEEFTSCGLDYSDNFFVISEDGGGDVEEPGDTGSDVEEPGDTASDSGSTGGDTGGSTGGGDSGDSGVSGDSGDSAGDSGAASGIPCSGQEKCYNEDSKITCPKEGEDFYGQDAQHAKLGHCRNRSLKLDDSVPSQNIFIDRNRGLEWHATLNNDPVTFSKAKDYCAIKDYGGKSDWRMPNRYELQSFVDYNSHHTRKNLKEFWTSSATWDSTVWIVDLFNDSGVVSEFEAKYEDFNEAKLQFQCVRGKEYVPSGEFSVSKREGDEIVKNSKDELTWQKDCVKEKSWKEALAYCENLSYGGYDNWRLPNIIELSSLLPKDTEQFYPASNFPDMPSISFWSSTSNAAKPGDAWVVDFYDGGVYGSGKGSKNAVRCVR